MPNDDSYQHVVKTSEQWDERAVKYWVVPRGCLCIELTSKGKTKIKIGEGDKYYHQLTYVSDYEELNNYYTKEEVDNLIKNLDYMSIKSVDEYDSKNDLPKTGNSIGDVRFVKSASPSIKTDPDIYLWNGSRWILVGSSLQGIDLSEYAKKSEIIPRIESLEKQSHTHDNKYILDKIKEDSILSDEDRNKFDKLHNYDDSAVRNRLQRLENIAHDHDNKMVLDKLTPEVIDNSHKHENQEVLDQITAPFTVEEKEKLESLQPIEDYVGASEESDGVHGLVPSASAGEQNKFLRADGTWQDIQDETYTSGIGIEINEDDNTINNTGVLDVVSKPDNPGVINIKQKSGDTDIDILSDLGKITLNCNNNPD